MGAIPSGKGGERFPPLFPSKTPNLGGDLGGAAGGVALDALCSGRTEGRKERVGEKRPAWAQTLALSRQPAWRDNVVAPVHLA